MSRDAVGPFDTYAAKLWVAAVLFFGVGDVATTAVGLSVGAVEAHPIVGPFVEAYFLVAMVPLKILAFALCYGLWRLSPPSHRVGVPLGLASVGLIVSVWNVYVIYLLVS